MTTLNHVNLHPQSPDAFIVEMICPDTAVKCFVSSTNLSNFLRGLGIPAGIADIVVLDARRSAIEILHIDKEGWNKEHWGWRAIPNEVSAGSSDVARTSA